MQNERAQWLHVAKIRATQAECKKKEFNDFILPKISATKTERKKEKAQWISVAKIHAIEAKSEKRELSDFTLPKKESNRGKKKKGFRANILIFLYKLCKLYFDPNFGLIIQPNKGWPSCNLSTGQKLSNFHGKIKAQSIFVIRKIMYWLAKGGTKPQQGYPIFTWLNSPSLQ